MGSGNRFWNWVCVSESERLCFIHLLKKYQGSKIEIGHHAKDKPTIKVNTSLIKFFSYQKTQYLSYQKDFPATKINSIKNNIHQKQHPLHQNPSKTSQTTSHCIKLHQNPGRKQTPEESLPLPQTRNELHPKHPLEHTTPIC